MESNQNQSSKRNDNLELFDLEKDPKELNDVSINHPDIVKKIEKILTEARTRPALKIST